jgi:hypothetical protein
LLHAVLAQCLPYCSLLGTWSTDFSCECSSFGTRNQFGSFVLRLGCWFQSLGLRLCLLHFCKCPGAAFHRELARCLICFLFISNTHSLLVTLSDSDCSLHNQLQRCSVFDYVIVIVAMQKTCHCITETMKFCRRSNGSLQQLAAGWPI